MHPDWYDENPNEPVDDDRVMSRISPEQLAEVHELILGFYADFDEGAVSGFCPSCRNSVTSKPEHHDRDCWIREWLECRQHCNECSFRVGQRVAITGGLSKGMTGIIRAYEGPSPMGVPVWRVDVEDRRTRLIKQAWLKEPGEP